MRLAGLAARYPKVSVEHKSERTAVDGLVIHARAKARTIRAFFITVSLLT
jgi:hypothetical protein